MKSFEQLARTAYEAGMKSMQDQRLSTAKVLPWSEMSETHKNVWIAVARSIVQEMASVQ